MRSVRHVTTVFSGRPYGPRMELMRWLWTGELEEVGLSWKVGHGGPHSGDRQSQTGERKRGTLGRRAEQRRREAEGRRALPTLSWWESVGMCKENLYATCVLASGQAKYPRTHTKSEQICLKLLGRCQWSDATRWQSAQKTSLICPIQRWKSAQHINYFHINHYYCSHQKGAFIFVISHTFSIKIPRLHTFLPLALEIFVWCHYFDEIGILIYFIYNNNYNNNVLSIVIVVVINIIIIIIETMSVFYVRLWWTSLCSSGCLCALRRR